MKRYLATSLGLGALALSSCVADGPGNAPLRDDDDAGVSIADARYGALGAAEAGTQAGSDAATPPAGEPGRYIVVFKRQAAARGATGARSASVASAVAASMRSVPGAEVVRLYRHALDGATMKLTPAALAALRADPRVAYVEPDAIVTTTEVQSNATWGLDRIDQRTRPLDQSFTYPTHAGDGVNAYVLDTGIYAEHTEFALPGGGSRVVPGYDFIDNDSNPADCHGHGTHVAGTIGGKTWGVAKKVTLHSVRVLGCLGSGTTSGVIAGVDWVTANHVAPAVANMSLGGGFSQALNDAVTNSIAAGVTYAVAAGNSAADACVFSPASTPSAMTVAASTIVDTAASFTNFGACVDLFAPGEQIISAWVGSPTISNTISGTSMATPHVVGAAALWLSLHPAATPADVSAALIGRASRDLIPFVGAGTPNLLLFSGQLDADADTTPPTATITGPLDGSTVTDVATVSALANDGGGSVAITQLFVNGVPRLSDAEEPWTFSWDAKDLPAGSYQLVVKAIDASGNIGSSAPVTVNLEHGLSPASLVVTPSILSGGASSTATVTLNQAAPAGGAMVELASSNPALATVPATVGVAEGTLTATFPINTTVPAATATATISATMGPVTRTAALTVRAPARLTAFTLSTPAVPGGVILSGTVTLTEPALTPIVIALGSSNAAAVVPSGVTIPAEALGASFSITTTAVAANTAITLTATDPVGIVLSAALTVTTAPPPTVQSLVMNVTSIGTVTGGASTTGTVLLKSTAPLGGAVVVLSNNNPAIAAVPASVFVPAGSNFATFTIGTSPVAAPSLATISATLPVGTTVSASLTVVPPVLSNLTVNPGSLIGGSPSMATVTLTGRAPPGGVPLTLATNNAAVALVSPNAIVPAGSNSVTFPISTFSVVIPTVVRITATEQSGRTTAAVLTVGPQGTPTLVSMTLNPTIATGGTSATATVTVSQPALTGGLVVALASSNPAVATVPATATVFAGVSLTSFLVQTTPQTSNTTVTITATLQGVTQSAVLSISALPRLSRISLNTAEVPGGTGTTGFVSLTRAAPAPMTISLGSDSPSAIIPAAVTVPTGAVSVSFPVSSTTVTSIVTATVTATLPDNPPQSAQLRIFPSSPIPLSLVMSPSAVQAGETTTATVTLDAPAPAGGAVLALSNFTMDIPSFRQAVTMPAALTIPAGATSATFPVVPNLLAGAAKIFINARMNGVTAQGTFTVLRTIISGNSVRGALAAPECATVGAFCDTGSLIDSRSFAHGAAELGTPNTINNSCADGDYPNSPGGPLPGHLPYYHVDHSLDRLRVFTADGSALAANKTVTIEATIWSSGGSSVDLYSAPDATNPTWTFIKRLTANEPNQTVLSTTFVLPNGTRQAIRGVLDGTPLQSCATTPFGASVTDYDDLVFATDNGGTPTNIGPRVNGGPDQAITLPPVATLSGVVTDDGLPNPPGAVAATWSKVSGPGGVTFGDVTAPATTATFSVAGVYVLRLSATDDALSAEDTVAVAVNVGGPPNQAPVVNAGSDQTVTLPATATLAGGVTDDGAPNPPGDATHSWSLVSGPGPVSFDDATSLTPVVTFTVAGSYSLRLTADDGQLTASDEVEVVVVQPPNAAPVTNAGPDQTIALPAAASLAGTVIDDGLPTPPAVVSIAWTKVSGPGTVTFVNAGQPTTTAAFSASGSYVLRLTANDGALSTSDTVTVTVRPHAMKARYRIREVKANDNHIKPHLELVNNSAAPIPLSQIKARYWYTIDTNQPQSIWCDYAQVDCAKVTRTFNTVSPSRPGADRYVEFGFTSAAGNLAAGASTGLIQLRWNKNDWSDFREAGDHSYSTGASTAAPTSFVDWPRVTIYQNGTLIWGVEP